jgi:hypothetical protein
MNPCLAAALASAAVALSSSAGSAQTKPPAPPIGATVAPLPVLVGTPGPAAATVGPPIRLSTPLPTPAGGLALDAGALQITNTSAGYQVTGQAQVNDACMAAHFVRFLGTSVPPHFNVVQYRRAGTMGKLCIQRLTWVTIIPIDVRSRVTPPYVTARTQTRFVRVKAPVSYTY